MPPFTQPKVHPVQQSSNSLARSPHLFAGICNLFTHFADVVAFAWTLFTLHRHRHGPTLRIRYTLYGIRNVVRSTFCWHCSVLVCQSGTWEHENGSIGRRNTYDAPRRTFFEKKKKTYKKYVVSPFEGVITRGDSLYSLDISCAKCFLPWWTQLSGEMGVRFISFNQLWCLLIK